MNQLEMKDGKEQLIELTPEQMDNVDGGWVYEIAVVGGAVGAFAGGYAIGKSQGFKNNVQNGGGGGGGK